MNSLNLIVLGSILNPISDNKCEYYKNGAMLLEAKTKKGEKAFYVKLLGSVDKVMKNAPSNVQILDYEGKTIIPSFFDMHFHWVQDDVREMPKANLLHWLDTYTFPAEKKFQSKRFFCFF